MNNPRTAHLVAAAVACLLWSGSLVASKLSYDTLAPMSLGLIRFSLATVAFFAAPPRQGRPERARRTRHGADRPHRHPGHDALLRRREHGVSMLPASTSSLIVGSFPP